MDDDSAAIISFAGEAGHLKRLPRSGWLPAHIADLESVAEHSFRVAVFAFAIAAQRAPTRSMPRAWARSTTCLRHGPETSRRPGNRT
jgi:5'-deoxynucleotidase YfbR-like HD superfamily hydrolase